jgi:adenylate cyclase class IV
MPSNIEIKAIWRARNSGQNLRHNRVVRKTRTLYLVGQTRIHIDQGEGLGDFLELEVVVQPGQTGAEAKAIAAGYTRIAERELVASA